MRSGRSNLLFVSLTLTLSACRGCTGDEEVALCDAMFRTGKFDSGAAFLQKPFAAEGLLRKLREVLDQ
jgi:hypothetical protein